MTYRVGRSLGRTIYRQIGDEPSKADEFIGIMDTREQAAVVVAALNAYPSGLSGAAGKPCCCSLDDEHCFLCCPTLRTKGYCG